MIYGSELVEYPVCILMFSISTISPFALLWQHLYHWWVSQQILLLRRASMVFLQSQVSSGCWLGRASSWHKPFQWQPWELGDSHFSVSWLLKNTRSQGQLGVNKLFGQPHKLAKTGIQFLCTCRRPRLDCKTNNFLYYCFRPFYGGVILRKLPIVNKEWNPKRQWVGSSHNRSCRRQ